MKIQFATLWGFARPMPDVLTFITPIFSDGNDNYFIQESISGKVVDFTRVVVGRESQEIDCPFVVAIGDPEICGFEFSPDNIKIGSGHALAPGLIEYSQTLNDERLQTKNAIARFAEALADATFDSGLHSSQTIHIFHEDLQWKWHGQLQERTYLAWSKTSPIKSKTANTAQEIQLQKSNPPNSPKETRYFPSSPFEFDMVDNATQGTVIKIVGVGGAGGNFIHQMIAGGMHGFEFIVANTDAQALCTSKAHNIIQLGASGLGAGMHPEIGRKLAEETRGRIEDALRGAHLVFIVAGMGGGTGTGASPIVAEVAKEMGALTIAVVTKPFSYEGKKCMEVAEAGLEELTAKVDSLTVILNEKLEEIYEDESMLEWFQYADDVVNNAVAIINEIINVPGHINVDFNDVKTIMAGQGKTMIGTGTASGVDRARIAARQALSSPLLDVGNLTKPHGMIVNITASRSLRGSEIKQVMAEIRAFSAPDATIAQGIAYEDAMGDSLRVNVVATGFGKFQQSVQLPMLRTGTGPIMDSSINRSPAIWRRESASEQGRAMEENGMETYDIPAFFRKQAD